MVLINDNSSILAIGDHMPAFQLPATDGMTVDSSTIKDTVVAVIFTCNHCPYAKAYEDRIVDLAQHFDEQGVQLVLISSNDALNYPEDSFEQMKQKHDEKGYPFPYCYDESQEVAKAYGALCTPHCFVFDADRKLQYKGRIDDNWQEEESVKERNLFDALDALVRKETPAIQEANSYGCSIKWK